MSILPLPVRVALFAIITLFASAASASIYQWSAPVPPPAADPTHDKAIAYLWIPPGCHQVRAVVIGQHNMIEENILDDDGFRRTLADLGFAAIWITPSADNVFRFDQDAVARFDSLLKTLGALSGYAELACAPVVPIGHSAHASYPWNFAAAQPGRTLAILSVKGDAPLTPLTGSGKPNPDWGDRTLDGVPGLMVMGQFEWWHNRLAPAEAYRLAHPASPIALLGDVGHGHFDCSPLLIDQLGLFLRKAALHRLPAVAPLDAPVHLRPVDPHAGWLVDEGVPTAPATRPPRLMPTTPVIAPPPSGPSTRNTPAPSKPTTTRTAASPSSSATSPPPAALSRKRKPKSR